jgi:hypothetical protein
VSDKDGKSGDVQITMNEDKTYTFEIRTKDGWKTPVIGESLVKFTDKPHPKSKNKKQSIDQIEADDSNTGAVKAKKTIYDEKSDKFVLPRPDYESDWTDVTSTGTDSVSYNFEHNLGTKLFKLVQVIFKDDSENVFYPTVGQHEDGTHNSGIYLLAATDDIVNVGTGNDYIYMHDNTSLSDSLTLITEGYIKVMLWK